MSWMGLDTCARACPPPGPYTRRMEWLIRQAEPADADALHRFTTALFEERLAVLYSRAAAPSLTQQQAFIEKMAAAPRSALFVALARGGEVAGILDFHAEQRPETAHGGQFGMSVARAFRRQGVGRDLLDALCAWAGDAGVVRVELQVFETNIPAIRLYERAGFEHEGRRRRAVRIAGSDVDVLLMAKLV